MKTRALVVVLCLITVAAFGQSNPKLKELPPFVGTFHCTGMDFASKWGPEHPTKATVIGSWTLGGKWLQIRFTEMKTAKNPHPYDALALWGYDKQSKMFVAGAVDNMGGYYNQQSPGWEGNKLVFTGILHGASVTANFRDILTKVGNNEMIHEGEIEENGQWRKLDKEVCKR
jgi:hypothetical protein